MRCGLARASLRNDLPPAINLHACGLFAPTATTAKITGVLSQSAAVMVNAQADARHVADLKQRLASTSDDNQQSRRSAPATIAIQKPAKLSPSITTRSCQVMPRPIELSRDEAELIDEALMGHIKDREHFDPRMVELAEQLRDIWGWSRWDKRPGSGISTEEYESWLNRHSVWPAKALTSHPD